MKARKIQMRGYYRRMKEAQSEQGGNMNYQEENATIAAMKREAQTEATCQVCGQVTTLNMLKDGVHYSANLCRMFRQGK